MQLSIDEDDIDELLVGWETLKHTPIPIPSSLDDALNFTLLKDSVSLLSHLIRTSRLENNYEDEEHYTSHFYSCYDTFMKEYVFRILKHG